MSEHIEKVHRVDNNGDDITQTTHYIDDNSDAGETRTSVFTAARLVWFVADVIIVLLAFRFVFALLGANTANPFANFIYSTSYPFAAPFFGLFSYKTDYGVSHLEISTLIAMAVYALIAFGITRLITIRHPHTY
jgi:uncharacterized protein YggT (Ycf19 family)